MSINKLVFAGIMSVGLLASCAGDETAVDDTAKAAVVNLNVSTTTRTSGTSLPTGTGLVGEAEGTLNRICVCFYNSTTQKVVTLAEYTSSLTSLSVTTTTAADSMYVIANAPSGAFAGQTTASGIRTVIQNLKYTTYASSATTETTVNSQNTNYLPMVDRKATGLSSGTTTSSLSVSLKRLVARAALTGITVDFSSNTALSSAGTFQPTEIFMYNANDQLTLEGACTSSSANSFCVASGLVSGETTGTTTSTYSTATTTNYSYLSSGYLSSTASTAGSSTSYLSSSPYYFYVYPNTKTASPTKLVIKGLFYDGSTTTVVYYPIIINHAQTGTTGTSGTETVDANTCYNIAATIQGRGSTGPDVDVTPATVTATISVSAWTTNTEGVTFN